MSVSQVQCWAVKCDTCGGIKPTETGGPELFFSYDSAVSLARLDGWTLNPVMGVRCPSCFDTEEGN